MCLEIAVTHYGVEQWQQKKYFYLLADLNNTDSTITESIIVESKEQIIVPSESAPSSTIPSQDNVTWLVAND